MEQLLRAGEASKSKHSPTHSSPSSSSPSSSSPFFQRLKHHDQEEDHGQNQKKSVLTKVKEKAKKLRHSLSKKKHEDGNSPSPTSGAGLEGDGVEEDVAGYLGAPMYESEKAPLGYKENPKQNHPRGNPATPEKHFISSNDKHVVEQNQEKTLSRSLSKKTPQHAAAVSTTTTIPTTITSVSGANKAKNIAEKLTPVYAEGSEAANSVTSKIQGITVSKPKERLHHHYHHYNHTAPSKLSPTSTTINKASLSLPAPSTPPAKGPAQTSPRTMRTTSAPAIPASSLSPAAPSGKTPSPTAQIWDKGVSVKEYLMNKLEPGEDEKALSQVISEAMSPKRTPGDAGVMEKVREAVTSLLRNEEPTKYEDATPSITTSSQILPASPNATSTSTQIPISTNAREVVQEENHDRILQAN
ncbi:proteoglycan 4-like [Abrus precatorius]|uniref:Proteoglycan 4-like n=1 Tax=Abrus precatorius TaxID=3816 RepID=A0A8B8KV21_ABRPR|nr:proteoglycan 4-like [Abrus precatorius]